MLKKRWFVVLAVVGVVGGAVFLGVWMGSEPLRISSFEPVGERGFVLTVRGSCDGEPDVDVTESEFVVRVLVESEKRRDRDCAPSLVDVRLDAELGDRFVVDVSTGDRIYNSAENLVKRPLRIASYQLGNEHELIVQTGSCNFEHDIYAEETESKVRILVNGTIGFGDCPVVYPRVQLDAELLDRVVVDGSSGLPVVWLRSGL